MNDPLDQSLTPDFAPPTRYVAFLWTILGAVQIGLLVLWRSPLYGSSVLDLRSWIVWAFFDAFLLVGVTQATRFRVRVWPEGLEYLAWNFRWTRWDWDEMTRLDRWSGAFGPRYRVRSTRGAFYFSRLSLSRSAELAALIVEKADLDDMGELTLSLQSGALHVWLHPSAADEE
jgi:hypothetical protein